MAFDLVNEVYKLLSEHPSDKFEAREIAEHIYRSFPDYLEERTKKSAHRNKSRDLNTKDGWLSQLTAEIGAKNPQLVRHPHIEVLETRPKKYLFATDKTGTSIDQLPIETREFSDKLSFFLEAFRERREEPFSYDELLTEAMNELKLWLERSKSVSLRPNLKVTISVGKGNWTKTPWIAILDREVTETTQKGIYVVFLVAEDLSVTYLTLNQGMTQLSRSLGDAAATKEMRRVSAVVRPKIEKITDEGFTLDEGIDLKSQASAARKYEAGTIAHLALPSDDIPDDGAMEHHLNVVLGAYELSKHVEISQSEDQSEQSDLKELNQVIDSYTVDDALDELFLERQDVERYLDIWRHKKNLILQGAPGVGKSFIAKRLAYALIGFKDDGKVQAVQFHQSYSYEDFVQGYRPNGNQGFERKNGSFYEFRDRALADPSSTYVFIIDEINRGNLSKIFGELMLLIEADKRGPMWKTRLAYASDNDQDFYVPDNLFILGMMNTADRSLSLVDYALRRRFAFVAMEPLYGAAKFRAQLERYGIPEDTINQIVNKMGELNQAIESDRTNLGPGFRIGHSFFTPTEDVDDPEAWYRRIVETEIYPLLEEYWFDAPETADQWRNELLR
ncbi:DUF3578 domain-containing protein [uncultured Roseibium sp.]|uniref:MrcB family domain-containing protein n=1 Tax=uncultured Roseibium sp. TaxID=1936171 RepID=UPI00260F1EC3|nr:DUF3578 domain-containing protein [uncultured Roseibium sp.]